MPLSDRIEHLSPCLEGVEYLNTFDTWEDFWQKCNRGDWMLWLCGKLAGEPMSDSRRPLALAACECARLSLPYLSPRSRENSTKLIRLVETWATNNTVTRQHLLDAATYGAGAAGAAYAAYSDVAAAAAYAATYGAGAGAAYAAAAVRTNTLARCADIVRKHYPKIPMEVEL
ncbi:hypothetical protein LCGC14_0357290 [marine sediment metagenome]|uniref:Uncharacterized protein n=1 Tax=marine sediment metagenome TaxID=412755 RepID=A0A0F9T960_9ZZZZ